MLSASKSGSGLATGYNLTRSLRFRASASAYLNRTMSTPTNNKIWTYSFWVKRGQLGAFQQVLASRPTSTPYSLMYFGDTDNFQFDDSGSLYFATSQLFRDVASWYHIVVAVDTTQATSTNRFKLYVNGVQVTAFSSTTYPAQNYNTQLNTASSHAIGKGGVFTTNYLDGYLTEINFIDGQALTPSSFGSTNALTGVWQPARYSGSYGTNGFYLPFTDNSALTTSSNVGLGKDFSGNGNYWTTNNISITTGVTYDSMTDVPTLTSATAANFAVLNPLFIATSASNPTLTQGNLAFVGNITNDSVGRSTIGVTTGSFYCEITIGNVAAIQDGVGIAYTQSESTRTAGVIYRTDGTKCINNTVTSYGSSYVANDVIGIALNATSSQVTFYKNNVSQGAISFTPTTAIYFSTYGINSAGSFSGNINFGQRPFTYTPPTGFVALNTFNLPTSTIVKGNTVFDATLYTGTGASLSVTNTASFKPDLVWLKRRSAADDHAWYDSVRGVQKQVESNTTTAETTETTGLTAFGSTGFTVGALAQINANAATYVGWQWQAGQGSSSSNTNGTITSTVSVNASAGFSVVTYTGDRSSTPQTVGHGLGVAPAFIIFKSRNNASQWLAYHQSLGNTKAVYPNLTDAAFTTSGFFNNTSPTSSVFTINTANENNGNLYTMVAYCWTPIAGFSAFGSYSGNNSTDGPMVYTGFQPKFVLIKGTGNASGWQLQDSARNTYNVVNAVLRPDLSAAESTGYGGVLDFLSNGFKLRTTDTNYNSSSYGPYIYMAFATNPFKNSLGV